MSNLDKDIHMLKSYAGMTHKLTDNQGRPKLDQAIENVLKELEIKDKMIDLIAEKLAKKYLSHPLRCTLKEKENIDCCKFKSCTECIKQYFRKWVQK